LGGDLFTLYVALELLTFAAVPLVCLDGRVETLRAALRYLLFALLGSALYLAGTTLMYGGFCPLDITPPFPPLPAQPSPLCGRRPHDRGASDKDRALPAPPLAAARPRRSASRSERRTFGAGCEGIFLHRSASLV